MFVRDLSTVIISDATQKKKILSVLDLISSKSCIIFKDLPPNFTETNFVNVTAEDGCAANVGFRNGSSHMSLNIEVC